MSVKNHHTHASSKPESKPFYKNWLVLPGIISVVVFVVFLGYEFIVQLPKAKQTQAQLEVEFKSVEPLPNANLEHYGASHKTSQALVDATYLTSANPTDIFRHYDAQLKQDGWQSYGTSGTTDWGRDLGGKSAYYCKGEYSAQLQYAGEKANYGWTYAFSVSWGLGDCKTEAKGGWVKQTVPTSLVLMAFGAFFAINGGVLAYNAWTKDSTAYASWFLRRRHQFTKMNFSKSFMSPSYSLWNARIVSPVLLAIGLFSFWAGAYSLWRNIFGG